MNIIDTKLNDALFEYCLRIGDTSLILGQRLSEWCGHAPILEEDIALSNISLDLIGQSRIILTHAGNIEGKGRTEDDLAYLRDARQFRNLLLVEQPNTDFAVTIARQYFVSSYNFQLYEALALSGDATLAAFASKSVKEVAYHVRHSADWVLRLGDGTEVSHTKMQDAINDLWYYVDDMFQADDVDAILLENNFGANITSVKKLWEEMVHETLTKASLTIPVANNSLRMGSRSGNHTEHLGYILAEMQFLPRAYPDAKW